MKKLLSLLALVVCLAVNQKLLATDTLSVSAPRLMEIHKLTISAEEMPYQLPIRLVELAEELNNPALLSLDERFLISGHRLEDIIPTGNRYQVLTVKQEGQLVQLYTVALDQETLEPLNERRLLAECISSNTKAGLASFKLISTDTDIFLLSFSDEEEQPGQGYKFR